MPLRNLFFRVRTQANDVEVIRNRKWKDRQHNIYNPKEKGQTNNDLQNTTQKTKD